MLISLINAIFTLVLIVQGNKFIFMYIKIELKSSTEEEGKDGNGRRSETIGDDYSADTITNDGADVNSISLNDGKDIEHLASVYDKAEVIQPSALSNSNCDHLNSSSNISVQNVSRKLPNGVTVTRVPKEVSNSPTTSLMGRKNRDVIVTANGIVLDNLPRTITRIPIAYEGFVRNIKPMKSRSKRGCFRNRAVGRKPKPKGMPILPRMLKKPTNYIKISETCKICLHHFTVKQAYDSDQKVNIPILYNKANLR